MNWIHFLLWLAGIYFLYYLAVILWDTLKNKTSIATKAAGAELTFSEHSTPKDAAGLLQGDTAHSAAQVSAKSPPEMIASGGVLLKDIFGLARKEAIVYLKEVAFS